MIRGSIDVAVTGATVGLRRGNRPVGGPGQPPCRPAEQQNHHGTGQSCSRPKHSPRQPCGDRIDAQQEGLDGLRDVLQRLRAKRLKGEAKTGVDVVADRARNADTAFGAHRLQPGRDVHTITDQVRFVRDGVAYIDAKPESHVTIREFVQVVQGHLLLDLDRASDRAVDAVEHDHQRVAAGLRNSAAVFMDCRVNKVASECLQAPQRVAIIQPDQSAVSDHVGEDDDDQSAATCSMTGESRAAVCIAHDADYNTIWLAAT